MRYESPKTEKGNIGVSYVSAEKAADQAAEMDMNGCTDCTNCTDCTDCTDCTGCTDCTDCTDCTGCTGCTNCTNCTDCTGCTNCTDCTGCTGCTDCTDCTDCTGCTDCTNCTNCTDCTGCTGCTDCTDCTNCTGFVVGKPGITPEKQIENLDRVGAVILDNAARLKMDVWHKDSSWRYKTCAEEVICGTSHCLAGWLQVCATDPEIRSADTQLAGALQAPVAAKMFFRDGDEVLAWLRDREYVKELGVVEQAPEAPAAGE